MNPRGGVVGWRAVAPTPPLLDDMLVFAEVVSEHKIVAPTATIYDATGAVAVNFADGLPAKVTFTL